MTRPDSSPPARTLWLALAFALVFGVGLHCGSASSDEAQLAGVGVGGTPPVGSLSAPDGGPGDPGPTRTPDGETPPPNKPTVPSDGVVIVNASSWFPAFRICPAAPGATTTAPSGTGGMLPVPTGPMPGSSLAGVDIQGAVRIAPQPAFRDVTELVLIRIDETTKVKEALSSATCASLACASGGFCLGTEHLTLVSLPGPDLLTKAGTVLVLEDDGPGKVRFVASTPPNGPGKSPGTFDVALVNVSGFDGGVRYFPDAGDAGGVDILDAAATTPLPYVGYGGELAAGSHRETLLGVHASSAPRTPIGDFYASPGAFALVLVGSPTPPPDGGRPLKFLAVPMHRPDGGL